MATPPTAPDPYALTNAQTRINQQNANFNAAANAGNTTTPVGSSTFTSRIDPATGATIWDQNISLAPDQQALLNQQNAADLSLGGTQQALAGQVQNTLSNPLDTSGLPALTSNVDTSGLPKLFGADDLLGARQQVQDALYQRQTSYLDPQYQQREDQFRSRAASQGLVEGSQAWTQARDQFMRERAFEYDRARTSAIAGGMDEMQGLTGIASGNRSQLFGEGVTNANLGNSARAQALNEALTKRALPLSEYNALKDSTKVTLPQFNAKAPVSAQAADLSGNVNTNFQNQVDLYNAAQTSQNAQREGLVGLAGNLLSTPTGQGLLSSAGSALGGLLGIGAPAAATAAGAAPAAAAAGTAAAASAAGAGAPAAAGAAPAAASGGLGTLGTIGAGLGLAAGAAGAYEGIRTGNEGMAALGGGVAGVSAGLLGGLSGMAALGPVGLAAAGVTALASSLVNTKEFGDVALRNYWAGVDQGRSIGESDPTELAQGFINFYRTNKNDFPGQAVYGRTGNEDFMFDMTQKVNQAVQSGAVPPDATPGQVYEAAVKPWLASMGPGPQDERARAIQDFMMTDLINSFMTGKPISNAQIKNDSKFRIVSERPVYAGQAPQQGAQTLAEPLPWQGQGMPDYSQLGLMGGF